MFGVRRRTSFNVPAGPTIASNQGLPSSRYLLQLASAIIFTVRNSTPGGNSPVSVSLISDSSTSVLIASFVPATRRVPMYS
jgi:hypothetical protein